MFWFRFRVRVCDKRTEDLSYPASPVHYCETRSNPSRDRPSIFHTNGFASEAGQHASIGKRLSYSGSCERRDVARRETRRIASLPIIDCKRTSPTNINGANPRRTPTTNSHFGTDEEDSVAAADLYSYPASLKPTDESIPAKLVWDKVAQTAPLKERFTARNYFRQKKASINQSIETYNESLELKSNVSSSYEAPRHDDDNLCSYVNVVTVTSFGPNETINTELW